ncbi:hypothetical protein [Sphingomonas hengshuiensis]|uniref:Lipoprotein n=1 Tax=Sphingomonas hengshuiensis TaxID=1609977 RepID=A0A7U4J773_9SPHN|nr:hypothetical protein [Sphingomonas hengshuiensis]AJP71516.1 hypothetical protein TS85_06595 [Sphingomonas hengshuiensis]
MISKTLPLAALCAALALAACGAPDSTDNAMVNVGDAAGLGDTPDNSETPLIENLDADTTEAVAVPAVPKPAASASAAETAPLTDAAKIETAIRSGTGIQRVRHGEGWAWTRGGKVVRTADRDGGNIAYFRPDSDRPFLIQRGDRAFAYQGDKPVRSFDREGRVQKPDPDRIREAEEAGREARTQREHAERARETARPAPAATGNANPRDRGGREDRDEPRGRATPTPTPSATPRDRGDRPDRDSDRPERN